MKNVDTLKTILREVKNEHPFALDAIVVLPDHLHCIWTMPSDDADFSTRWSLIKSRFSRALPKTNEPTSSSRQKRGERGVWQRRFWEHKIRDERDFEAHVDYIHFDPVKHGYCASANNWPYSSFKQFVKRGVYSADWGEAPVIDSSAGEMK